MLERSGLSTPAPAKQNQRSSLDVLQRLLEVNSKLGVLVCLVQAGGASGSNLDDRFPQVRARENESIRVVQIAPGMHAAPPAALWLWAALLS